MEQQEAHDIAKAYADVAEYYPVMKMPGHVAAIVNLSTIIGVNYGARFMSVRLRKSMKRREAAQTAPQAASPVRQQPTTMQVPQNPATPPNQMNGSKQEKPTVTREMRTGEIPGIGAIEFPPDHPLINQNPFIKH